MLEQYLQFNSAQPLKSPILCASALFHIPSKNEPDQKDTHMKVFFVKYLSYISGHFVDAYATKII